MPTTVLPSLGDVTDPVTVEQIIADLTALEGRATALEALQELYVAKTADESVTSSSTLQDDNHLLLSVAANTDYYGLLVVLATSAANAAGDIHTGFTFPAGATLHWGAHGPTTALASGSVGDVEYLARLSATSGTTEISYGLSTSILTIVHYLHLLTAGTAGTLRLQWAQQASNGSATTVKAGSYMWLKPN